MNKKPSFIRQANVLIDRYFHIFFNDKQGLILTMAIPLLTILIVCLVACGDMYAIEPENNKQKINDGLPVLVWETVIQEKENEDKEDEDDPDTVRIEPDEVTVSKWDGETTEMPTTPTKLDGENYFLITSAEQLAFISQADETPGFEDYLTYNYLLQVDIDLKKYEFEPIGSKDHPFTGTFDGNGHIIQNLKINSEDNNVGLFAYVKSDAGRKAKVDVSGNDMTFYHNGIVKNLQVKNADVFTTGKNCGVIVGCATKTARVTSVSAVKGKVRANGGNVGAIVGKSDSENVEIYSCYSTASVSSKGKNIGGLVGDLGPARLSGAYASSKVTHSGSSENKNIGSVVGNCADVESQLKNVYYNETIREDNEGFYAVKDEDKKGYAVGVEEEELYEYASFLVPFKGIYTDYELRHPSEENEEKWEDDDYDAEKDKDLDNEYGFKKDDQLMVFGGTQTGLFMLVCVAIFVGICNSIQEICKERNILKREYMTNLRLGPYVVSKLVVQAAVCAVQMIIVVLLFAVFVSSKKLPDSGVIFSSMWIEYYITMFLLAFAADAMSLLISSIVKSSATANTFIPIILIVQIVFSGVLFEMQGVMDILANLMLSKWGIAALAASTGMNNAQQIFLIENPSFQLQLGSSMSTVKELFSSTASNLLMIWGILIVFIVVCSLACRLLLTRVKNDRR